MEAQNSKKQEQHELIDAVMLSLNQGVSWVQPRVGDDTLY